MTLVVSTIVDQARFTMNDPNPPPQGGNPLFSDAEMIGYVWEGELAVCQIKPDAYSLVQDVNLVAGSVQHLPDANDHQGLTIGTQLLDIYCNASDGSTVRMIDREALDHSNRQWMGGTQRKLVRRWFYDPRNPKQFLVTPPNNAAGSLTLRYCAVPDEVTQLADELVLDDTYQSALHAFVVARCYAKNTSRYDPQKATAAMTEFTAMVTARTAPQAGLAPTQEV